MKFLTEQNIIKTIKKNIIDDDTLLLIILVIEDDEVESLFIVFSTINFNSNISIEYKFRD